MEFAGWDVFRTPSSSTKLNSGRVPRPSTDPVASEIVLYAIKGTNPVTHIYPDVIPCNGDDNLGNTGAKPVELYVNLLPALCQGRVTPSSTPLLERALSSLPPTFSAPKPSASNSMKAATGICVKRLAELKTLEAPSAPAPFWKSPNQSLLLRFKSRATCIPD